MNIEGQVAKKLATVLVNKLLIAIVRPCAHSRTVEVDLLLASNLSVSLTDNTLQVSRDIMSSYIGMQQSQTAGQGGVSHKRYLITRPAHRQPSLGPISQSES